MKRSPTGRTYLLCFLLCLSMGGCGMNKQTRLLGRWYNKDLSIRFRPDGTVLYNSPATGLVEGRYQFEYRPPRISQSEPVKNLTVWLPQPGRTLVLNLELQYLGNHRIQLKEVLQKAPSATDSTPAVGMVLKRAENDNSNSNDLDSTPPLVSANPDQAN